MRSKFLLIFAALCSLGALYAAEPIAMAYYDVGELYDTSPSPFYDDEAYTPEGKNRWDEERYNLCVERITSVIDSLQMPIVALFGVENEEVVRDIVMRSEQDYNYIHRTLDYYDGLDLALLYFGDRLFVNKVSNNYHWLSISGTIDNLSIDIHLTRLGRKLLTIMPPDDEKQPDITVVAGRVSRNDLRRLGVDDPLRQSEIKGYGDSRSQKGWYFNSRIGVAGDVDYHAGLYITPWLLDPTQRYPLPFIDDSHYSGGYAPHLPIYLIIEQKMR